MSEMQFDPQPLSPPPAPQVNAMSVDVEEHFQVQALEASFDRAAWPRLESRVERNTERVLECFADAGVKATFFILSWIAERHPQLVRRIAESGHEVASHGMQHERADAQTPAVFRRDVRESKHVLEDISGSPVRGYRAATFSIGAANLWAFDVLAEEGYLYSSSVQPVRTDHYGMKSAPRFAFRPHGDSPLRELPLSTLALGSFTLPCAGGGYFRLLPYAVTRFAVRRVNEQEGWPFIFYIHPWELDPDQPRPDGVPMKSRFRHYTNLSQTEKRLRRLLGDFSWDRIDRAFAITGETRGA